MRWIVLALTLLAAPARAADPLVIAADARLVESGLMAYLAPRFALKHGLRAEVVPVTPGAPAPPAGVTLLPVATGAAFSAGNTGWGAAVAAGAPESARTFAGWLDGPVGRATVAAFEGPVAYRPAGDAGPAPAVPAPGAAEPGGERLALLHCGRCHVIGEANRTGGVGSTPSFPALRALDDWEAKFAGFWTANPHPSFTQVAGLTEPFARPPHIAPVELTEAEARAIIAFAAGIAPRDLGAPVQSR